MKKFIIITIALFLVKFSPLEVLANDMPIDINGISKPVVSMGGSDSIGGGTFLYPTKSF